jgi:hypothetical protein
MSGRAATGVSTNPRVRFAYPGYTTVRSPDKAEGRIRDRAAMGAPAHPRVRFAYPGYATGGA